MKNNETSQYKNSISTINEIQKKINIATSLGMSDKLIKNLNDKLNEAITNSGNLNTNNNTIQDGISVDCYPDGINFIPYDKKQ